MSELAPRWSCQVTIVPPAPSDISAALVEVPTAVVSATPLEPHWIAPAPLIRWTIVCEMDHVTIAPFDPSDTMAGLAWLLFNDTPLAPHWTAPAAFTRCAWMPELPPELGQVTMAPFDPSETSIGAKAPGCVVSAMPSVAHWGTPAPFTRWANGSAWEGDPPLRRSRHATIAPPSPSDAIWSCDRSPPAVHKATPSVVHCGAPEALTRWA
jgi:hypothetical protein